MSRRLWGFIGLAIAFSLNAAVLFLIPRRPAPWEMIRQAELVRETKGKAFSYRHPDACLTDLFYYRIGGLVKSSAWNTILPLSEVQKETITKFDQVVWRSRYYPFQVAAEYMDRTPPDYYEYSVRLKDRVQATIRHGIDMTLLGLLSEEQAELVTQRHLSWLSPKVALKDESAQMKLAMTEKQKLRLVDILNECNKTERSMDLWKTDPKKAKDTTEVFFANRRAADAEAMSILTAEQREIWEKMTVERVLQEVPPDMPVIPDSEVETIQLSRISPVFCRLANNLEPLGIVEQQKELLEELKRVVVQGLYWIRLNQRGDLAKADFLKHAEEIVLLGILTEDQERKVRPSAVNQLP